MSQQLITKTKPNKKSKKNIIFVIEGEFDITRMSELPDHIVHYCISFLATEEGEGYFKRNTPPIILTYCATRGCPLTEFRHNRPSKWFDNLLRSETERLWNTKYVPMLTKAFNKMTRDQIQKITRFNNWWGFVKGCDTKSDWIKRKLDFGNYKDNYRKQCIETILLSKGLTFSETQNYYLYLEPYNPEAFVCKL